MASEVGGMAYFHYEHASFLLQDCHAEALAHNFAMHMLVEDVEAWWHRIKQSGVSIKYGTKLTDIEIQPWRIKDFCITDPSGVVWRIAQNCN